MVGGCKRKNPVVWPIYTVWHGIPYGMARHGQTTSNFSVLHLLRSTYARQMAGRKEISTNTLLGPKTAEA